MSIEEASVPLAAIVEQMADAMVFADLKRELEG